MAGAPDKRLNIVVGVNLNTDTASLQQQLDEIAKNLKLEGLQLDPNVLNSLSEFAQSMNQITDAIKKAESSLSTVTSEVKNASSAYSEMDQSATASIDRINRAMSDLVRQTEQEGQILSEVVRTGLGTTETTNYKKDPASKEYEAQPPITTYSATQAQAEINSLNRLQEKLAEVKSNLYASPEDTTILDRLSRVSDNEGAFNQLIAQAKGLVSEFNSMTNAVAKTDERIVQLEESFKQFGAIAEPELKTLSELQDKLGNVRFFASDEGEVANYKKDLQEIASGIRDLESRKKEISSIDSEHAKALTQNAKMDLDNERNDLDLKMRWIDTYYKAGIATAKQSFEQLTTLYKEDETSFEKFQNLKMQAIVRLSNYQAAAEKEQAAQNGGGKNSYRFKGYAFNPLDITRAMIGFQAFRGIEEMASQYVQIQSAVAGLQSVLTDTSMSQGQVNQMASQFIDIAQRYGTSITDVLDAAKLWGRQYKDLNTILTLTNNSTLLAVDDNMKVTEANKAVESSLNTMGLAVTNVNNAYTNSMKLVDSWTAVSHSASVSAQDLTGGFERSAAAAHDAGLSVSDLNSLVAAGVDYSRPMLAIA